MKELISIDSRLTSLVQRLPNSLRPTMEALSFLGEPLVVATIAAAGFISATSRGRQQVRDAFIYAAILFVLSIGLKFVLHRRRPHDLSVKTFGIKSYSFPSGHAFGTVIFYGLFSYLDLKYLAHPWNYLVSLVLWVLIVLIGVSRIYLKAHYPTDVIAGWLLGLVCLFITVYLAF